MHQLRIFYLSKRHLISELDSFDVKHVACMSESDRLNIHIAIERWYGSLDAFSEYVRGPLRTNVLEPLRTPGSLPLGYICLLATPAFTVILEGLLSLLKGDAPMQMVAERATAYILTQLVDGLHFQQL